MGARPSTKAGGIAMGWGKVLHPRHADRQQRLRRGTRSTRMWARILRPRFSGCENVCERVRQEIMLKTIAAERDARLRGPEYFIYWPTPKFRLSVLRMLSCVVSLQDKPVRESASCNTSEFSLGKAAEKGKEEVR